jgi:predicted N-acetyltransferase YhbS
MQRALREARSRRHGAVLLVGDAPYYGRFGFSVEKTGALRLPGPYEQHRLLGLELKRGALDGARGLIRASGDRIPKGLPDFLTGAMHAPAPLAVAA